MVSIGQTGAVWSRGYRGDCPSRGEPLAGTTNICRPGQDVGFRETERELLMLIRWPKRVMRDSASEREGRRTFFQIGVIAVLGFWHHWISPLFGPACRFEPSCSCFAQQAVERHGIIRGLFFAIRRLLRCHPLHPGGYDPVP